MHIHTDLTSLWYTDLLASLHRLRPMAIRLGQGSRFRVRDQLLPRIMSKLYALPLPFSSPRLTHRFQPINTSISSSPSTSSHQSPSTKIDIVSFVTYHTTWLLI